MSIEIREVDVHDEAALREWWETGRAASDRPVDTFPTWERSRVALPADNPERDTALLLATEAGKPVGTAVVALPLADNLHAAYVELDVVPAARRQGHGSALLDEAEQRVLAAGRTTVLTEAYGAPGESPAGVAFGGARGYSVANTEEIKVVELAELDDRREALEAEAAARLGDYRVIVCTEVPDEHMAGFCRLLSGFLSQIPLGDLALEDSEWTAERVRSFEQRSRRIGRTSYEALALAPDGTVVGCSDVNISVHDPVRAAIGITIVDEQHRGHRLGLAMKLASHAALRAAYPECERVETSNAGVNAHMNAVNDQMGYRVTEVLHELQKVLDP